MSWSPSQGGNKMPSIMSSVDSHDDRTCCAFGTRRSVYESPTIKTFVKRNSHNDATQVYRSRKRMPSTVSTVEFDDTVSTEEVAISIFESLRNILKPPTIKTVLIPPYITTIEDNAFYCCSSLISVTLPHTITTLGTGVFCGCSSLTTIKLPRTIRTIGDSVFQHCSSLTSVRLPPMIATMGDHVFWNCSALTVVTLPYMITSLDYGVFMNCNSLTNVVLRNQIVILGDSVFSGCSSLTSVTLPSSITTLGNSVFANCTSLVSVTLPSTITHLGEGVFRRCRMLDYIDLSKCLVAIPTTTFEGCYRFNYTPGMFEKMLAEGGYCHTNPNSILYGCDFRDDRKKYYNLRHWARTRDDDGRLPLSTAANRSLKWQRCSQILSMHPPAVYEVDVLTGLPAFMLAAVGPKSDIESIYNLLKEYPCMLMRINFILDSHVKLSQL